MYDSYLCRGICGVLNSAQRHRVSQWGEKNNSPKNDVETRKRRLAGDDGVEVRYGERETQRPRRRRRRLITTARDSRKTAVGEHLYMKWGTLRATVVERGRRRRAWTRERREFYRAHCLVFPTAAVDFSAHAATCAAAATGRLPRPSATPSSSAHASPPRHPFPAGSFHHRTYSWTVRGVGVISIVLPRREQRDAKVKYVCLACEDIDFRPGFPTNRVRACVRV